MRNKKHCGRLTPPPPPYSVASVIIFFDGLNDLLMFNVSQPLDLRSMVSERDGYIIVKSKLPVPEQNGNKN